MAGTWEDKEKELANINMMIASVTGQGGSPGQLYKPPVTNPGRGEAVFGVEKGGKTFFEFLKALGLDKNDKIAGIPEFNSFMDRFKAGSSNPRFPSLNHHSPEAQKIILNTALRIRALQCVRGDLNFHPRRG